MMKKVKYIYWLILGVGLLIGCEQKTKTDQSEVSSEKDNTEVAGTFMHYANAQKMQAIDEALENLQKIESLSWEMQTKDHGNEQTQVEAYINKDGLPVKITEYFINGNFQPQGERNYYLEDNKLIAYTENRDVWIEEDYTVYHESRTIYDQGKPAYSETRSANFYGDIQDSLWKEIPVKTPSLEKVEAILSGTGRFETHLISIIKGDNLFLLLGEDKEDIYDRFTTPVMVENMTPFIQDILDHIKDYKFRPVNIQFKVVGDGYNEPQFRVLTDISWNN